MKALITGINGFVGGYLSEYLLTCNMQVFGTYLNKIDKNILGKNIKTFKLDITDKKETLEVLKKVRPDYIFHLAAQSSAAISWKKPQLTMDVNINGTINLLENIKELNLDSRILLIGSSEEYGFVKSEDIPINEDQELKPGNPYAVSKISQTMMGQVYSRAYDMDIVIVRAFNHIGPKQSPVFVASDFAKRIAEIEKGKFKPVLLVGNLEAERDFTDVRDIVKAYYLLALKGQKGEIYNVGSGKSYKIQYILDTLLSLSNVDIKIEKDPNRMRPSDVPIVQCDNTKITRLTGWEPEYSIEETLKDVLQYWRQTV
ncbi:GDP-mannose 4,6-dehydratase [Thermohalobacter berrensis]|uniref:GDP-mannose 4,6 dehydratase n=1 Tax=Thermohalobacter berrensis TaxID=99594 RepID=A0A419T4G1_9FIRM|nr:GDP-mannose 4,6-dehydratase [Thermohalobacter berrensis]RKD32268.1 GDP-mannose 4,6 dehydratase [Thermohalobacter berrensis]